jgi:hypothetical protein
MSAVAVMAPTAAEYQAAFEKERAVAYPMVDAFEARMGFAVDRSKLEAAARVLACPVKKNPPNWQHGRVLYAAARRYIASSRTNGAALVDIGTAKGFSALCLFWARHDAVVPMSVWSCDVIDPEARVIRNTVAEVDGLKTLAETQAEWPECEFVRFVQSTGVEFLKHFQRLGMWVGFAFVDGSHNGSTVLEEGRLLSTLQQPGDVAVFDDVDRHDIGLAVASLGDAYAFEYLYVLPNRAYAIGVRN